MASKGQVSTEQEMLRRLRAKVEIDGGTGPQALLVDHVRSDAGMASRIRTIDAVSLTLWQSRGLRLSAYEIKCSRRDWVQEMRNPAKAEEFGKLVDYFWLVVSDEGFVKEGELPDTWGLMATSGSGLKVVQEPTLLGPVNVETGNRREVELPDGFDRGFLVCLLKRAGERSKATPDEVQAQIERAVEIERQAAVREKESADLRFENLRERVSAFREASGVDVQNSYALRGEGIASASDARELGRAVRAVLDGDAIVKRRQQELERLVEQAERLAELLRREVSGGGD